MEIKQLKTFKTAAENLNFTLTAKQLNFAQSSVTAQIKSLEAELGTPLFERLGKRIVLTDAGKKYKQYADEIIRLSEEAHTSINEKARTGKIIIGAQESQCTYRLPPILKTFKQKYPEVKVIFKPAHSDEHAREGLLKGELDAAFITDISRSDTYLHTVRLLEEEMVLFVASDHPLAQLQYVSPEELAQETLLLTEEGCSYRTAFEETLALSGNYARSKVEFSSIEALKQCALLGMGAAILPLMAIEKEAETGLIKKLDWGNSLPSIYTNLAWHKDKHLSPLLTDFIKISSKLYLSGGSILAT
ncbi:MULTISPECIES: LysR family transcriptional regulator [Bacillaceae]|uniref:LysR family transcriptional regulator n=1 Tax=Bacillaceae TaxID=186817 RepID=UPI001E419D80|nr:MULTISPECIES: LysR family transcriptional regulator [Bacillaceae]MCE4049642.1 LysR family transcriptional regulator [Bacillus sp. Au-Bac7]MCM3031813.1 LysR family transcriptional regulator [Niallia sp. MER 6]MDL0436986.1 LysR family transcriptional regulator [Niallia sp. SS-2023]UPO87412.1 LysR family transcriptional regulator [Niallia sp. Man26]